MNRRQKIVLAALASQPGAVFAPVQVQKLFFLIDENVADDIGGRLFEFEPYDYGPFDRAVYDELELLEQTGLVQVISLDGRRSPRRKYALTAEGLIRARSVREELSQRVVNYMDSLSDWILKLSFAELVGSVYKAYPQMRVNSIFRD